MFKTLTSCTIMMLDILIKQYENGLISYDELYEHTKVKASFLERNFDKINDQENKVKTVELLRAVKEIICGKDSISEFCHV